MKSNRKLRTKADEKERLFRRRMTIGAVPIRAIELKHTRQRLPCV